uniref:General secretion pathway protein J n=1 Tax=Rheinheimera sp. BAL341 TaxID=1708203 RepID=A0A486XVY5_9GAMM
MALMSLLMMTAAYGYSFIAENWQRNQAGYNKQIQAYIDWQLVQEASQNIVPKLVYSEAPVRHFQGIPSAGFYFLGRDNGFTAYTAQSVQDPEAPAVFRLFREPDEKRPEHWQLVYEEAALNKVNLQHASQQLPFNFRRVLAQDLTNLTFTYQAWPSLAERMKFETENYSAKPELPWHSEFDGLSAAQHPLAISIVFNQQHWKIDIADLGYKQLAQLTTE